MAGMKLNLLFSATARRRFLERGFIFILSATPPRPWFFNATLIEGEYNFVLLG